MSEKLTKKGLPRKSNAGRRPVFEGETKCLRRLIPTEHFERIGKIVDYEISKLNYL